MVIVTPYVVRAVAQKELSRPDDGFAAASDPQVGPVWAASTASTAFRAASSRRKLSRQFRLHHRLRRGRGHTMTTRNTRRSQPQPSAWWARSLVSPSCSALARNHEEVRRRAFPTIIACGIRSRSRKPTAPSLYSSAMRAADCPPPQRADVAGLAQSWLPKEPARSSPTYRSNTSNAAAAAESATRKARRCWKPAACRRAELAAPLSPG